MIQALLYNEQLSFEIRMQPFDLDKNLLIWHNLQENEDDGKYFRTHGISPSLIFLNNFVYHRSRDGVI